MSSFIVNSLSSGSLVSSTVSPDIGLLMVETDTVDNIDKVEDVESILGRGRGYAARMSWEGARPEEKKGEYEIIVRVKVGESFFGLDGIKISQS